MGNRIKRTVLFAAFALLSISAFGAGAARLGTLRNADWVVTNAWQAVSNKTHDLILEIGHGDSWTGIVDRALSYGTETYWTDATGIVWEVVGSTTNIVGRVALTNDIPDSVSADLTDATNYTNQVAEEFEDGTRIVREAEIAGNAALATNAESADYAIAADGLIGLGVTYDWSDLFRQSTNAAVAVADEKISTNNAAFVSAVLAAPLVGADPSDLSEIAEYGSYGTVGAALLALIAGLAALKRRMNSAESEINEKANADALPYALVVPGEWTYSEPQGLTNFAVTSIEYYNGYWTLYYTSVETTSDSTSSPGSENDTSVVFRVGLGGEYSVTATRTLSGYLCDRAVNAVAVSTDTTLTLPVANPGRSRDLYVRLTVSATSAVTWTVAQGESWDATGAPPSSFAAGTYLYRLTEVAPGVFHAADLTSGGSIDPAVLDGKLDASSAAPPFSESLAYIVGEYVTYGGALYRCKTAVVTAGAWTGTSNWEAVDMTSPDATLDIRSDGRLEVVSAGGETLWIQGYDMSFASSVSLSCERVNLYAFTAAPAFDATTAYAANDIVAYDGVVYVFTSAHSAGAWTGSDASVYAVSLEMPTAPSGKVGDFVLDIDNTANSSASVAATLNGFGTSFDVFTPEGQNLLTDILTFGGGEQCELYFTMTAFGTAAKPAWKVVKQVVEKQEAGS